MRTGAHSAPVSISASKTGAAMQHQTVLLEAAVEALAIKPNGVYVDGTFGRGGHSRLILSKLGASGKLIALDRDLAAIESAKSLNDARIEVVHSHFSQIEEVLEGKGIRKVDGILLDLGISSPQIDEAERGFSFRFNAPLDMRMDQTRGKTAADWLAAVTEKQLGEVVKEYGEERFAKQVARAIIKEREDGNAITTTGQLAKVVASAIPKVEPGQNPATRTFQALRIFVNQELEELSIVLPNCINLLNASGRLVVISFHSLEDRMVKRFIQSEQKRDDLPANFPIKAKDLPLPRLLAIGKAVKPSNEEVRKNVRARSAVMRVAERTAAK
jgi:16S rRNA (cytosine1402-N4)-methyltransferase